MVGFLASIGALGSAAIGSVVVISIAYVCLSAYIQRKVSNAAKMRETQQKIKQISKEMNAMVKAGASPMEISAKQKELMPLVTESMKNSMKPLIILFPLTLLFYYLFVPALPFVTKVNVGTVDDLFIIVLVLGGILAGIVLGQYDKKALKKIAVLQESMQRDISPNSENK